jgi:alkylation response protein AidB-like acyl-CoA dehydrogenase
MPDCIESVRRFVRGESASLPYPGHGETARRHRALCELGRTDLSLARLAEAHADALAILWEAGHEARRGAIYGVWASDGPDSQVRAECIQGDWILDGRKQYCSGAPYLTHALVTAHHEQALLLFDVPLAAPGIAIEPSTWANPALSDTATCPVRFNGVCVGEAALLRDDNWYLQRPGFWHGALGPGACWAGGALSLIDAARRQNRRDPHSRAHRGALEAAAWSLNAYLERAALEIDADPDDTQHEARRRALMVRHLIERTCADVLDRFGRATGPALIAFDHQVARQYASLPIYMRQCHAERDLEAITA